MIDYFTIWKVKGLAQGYTMSWNQVPSSTQLNCIYIYMQLDELMYFYHSLIQLNIVLFWKNFLFLKFKQIKPMTIHIYWVETVYSQKSSKKI